MDKTKRRQEVRTETPNDARGSGAREKVLKHLRAAAVTGAGLVLACAGQPGHGPQANDQAGGQKPPNVTHPDGPPIVCDPLPPPINCDAEMTPEYVRSFFYEETRWQKTDSGLAAKMTLDTSTRPGPIQLTIVGEPEITGAKILKKERKETRLEMTFMPGRGKKEVEVVISLACRGKKIPVHLAVELSGPREEGMQLGVKVVSKK